MPTFAARLAGQLASPRGRAGQWLGAAMDLANRRATRMAVGLLSPVAGEDILDGGCGTGAALAQVARAAPCQLTGIDRSETMIAAARHRLGIPAHLHACPLEQAPLAAQSVDGALLLNVLYFCGPDAAMVAAVHRALRPGGRLVTYVTHRDTMAGWSFTRAGLHRLFDATALAALLQQGGFAPALITVHERAVAPGVCGLFAVAHR